MSGKVESSPRADDLLPESESQLPLPQWLAESLPVQLPRGTVAVLSGARSLLLGMVAAVTAAGGNVAIVGQPDIGLLAAAEMGADLSRLAVIPDPGTDPVEVAAVLDRRHGPGGARSGRAPGAADPGAGSGGAGPSQGLHPAGHRRRLARGADAAWSPGLRL